MKKLISVFLVIAIAMLTVLSFAAEEDTGYTDVDAAAWYADAVQYSNENGLMSGTGSNTFSPDETMSRAMLAAALYWASGSPAVTGESQFTDVDSGSWYADGVIWAVNAEFITGYGRDLFGTDDPVTREQIAAILWRHAESPAPAGGAATFLDAASISPWAAEAAAWAEESGIINGKPGNLFDAAGYATRAEVAVMLMNYLNGQQAEMETLAAEEPAAQDSGNVLIAYFSRTKTTEGVAGAIHDITGGDMVEIVTVNAYPESYDDVLAAAQSEQQSNTRPGISTKVENMDEYDILFIGYPIWYGTCPMAVFTFLEEYDLSDKIIVPFSTSGSSGISCSVSDIRDACPGSDVLDGLGLSGSSAADPQAPVASWLETLDLEKAVRPVN